MLDNVYQLSSSSLQFNIDFYIVLPHLSLQKLTVVLWLCQDALNTSQTPINYLLEPLTRVGTCYGHSSFRSPWNSLVLLVREA